MNEENKFYAGYWIRRFLCEYLTNIRLNRTGMRSDC